MRPISIDAVSSHHNGGDAGQFGDFCWDGNAGLTQFRERVQHLEHVAVCAEGELDHSQLDDLVAGGIEASRLDVEDDADLGRRAVVRARTPFFLESLRSTR